MKITIQSPGFTADQNLLTFVTKKIQRLGRFNERIIEVDVCLKLDKSGTLENKICEIKLAVAGNDLFASRNSQTFHDALINAINALKNQLLGLKPEYKGGAVIN